MGLGSARIGAGSGSGSSRRLAGAAATLGRGGTEENAQGRGDKANQIAKRKNHGVARTFIQYEHQGCSRLFLNGTVGRAGQRIFGR